MTVDMIQNMMIDVMIVGDDATNYENDRNDDDDDDDGVMMLLATMMILIS